MKKRYRIDAKSMLEKVMRKVWKIMPKGNQNGSQTRAYGSQESNKSINNEVSRKHQKHYTSVTLIRIFVIFRLSKLLKLKEPRKLS